MTVSDPTVKAVQLSSTAEVEHVSLPLWTNTRAFLHMGLLAVVLGLGGALLWAGFAPLDKGVAVSGYVTVAGNRKVVQSAIDGRIASLKVSDGMHVEAGQSLIELVDTPGRVMQDNLRFQRQEAQATYARLLAQRDDLPDIIFPAELTLSLQDEPDALTKQRLQSVFMSQRQLWQHQRQAMQQELASMHSVIARIQAEIAGARAMSASYQAQIALFQKQLQGLRLLAKEEYIARNHLADREREFLQLQAALAQEHHNIAILDKQHDETEQKISQRQSEYQQENSRQLVETGHLLQEITRQLKLAEFEVANSKITAPVSGTVVGLQVYTEGGTLSRDRLLMEIVPTDSDLLISAQLPVQLIDKVTVGLPAELLFTAFNQSTTPRITGRVVLAGADRLYDENNRLSYYELSIRVDEQARAQLSGFRVQPGMPVEVFIRTGERPLLSYLFKPLWDRLHLALSEE